MGRGERARRGVASTFRGSKGEGERLAGRVWPGDEHMRATWRNVGVGGEEEERGGEGGWCSSPNEEV